MVFLTESGDGDPSREEPDSLPVPGGLLNGLQRQVFPVLSSLFREKKTGGSKEKVTVGRQDERNANQGTLMVAQTAGKP
jgi:hypothetical protein